MDRRYFIRTGAAACAAFVPASRLVAGSRPPRPVTWFPRYRGFNLLEKFSGQGPRRVFHEEDFEIMAGWGFDFCRIPMSYWNWTPADDWSRFDEDALTDVDRAVELGRQYGIHVNLNLHRVPGYCINGRDREPMDLFEDAPERMETALEAVRLQWRTLARRYRGIPSGRLSFDLINEPPSMASEDRYVRVVRELAGVIREEDPGRLIVADGKDVGRTPVFGLADLGIVQSTRGYDPMSVSHYTAGWVPPDAFETAGVPTWPLKGRDGVVRDRDFLKARLIDPWKALENRGVSVHVGEWGCFNRTPHAVALAWMKDLLSLWKEAGWGWSLWNLKGSFGVLDSERSDVRYEDFKGHKLDREMLELILQY
jgi:endoglucanase